MKTKLSKHCRGCQTYDEFIESDYRKSTACRSVNTFVINGNGECPCSDCLVKKMCRRECEEYTKFRNEQLPVTRTY